MYYYFQLLSTTIVHKYIPKSRNRLDSAMKSKGVIWSLELDFSYLLVYGSVIHFDVNTKLY